MNARRACGGSSSSTNRSNGAAGATSLPSSRVVMVSHSHDKLRDRSTHKRGSGSHRKHTAPPAHAVNGSPSLESLRSLRDALRAARAGDFAVKMPVEGGGVDAEIALAFNA